LSIRTRLREDLRLALRAGNKTEVSMIRTLIGAIETPKQSKPRARSNRRSASTTTNRDVPSTRAMSWPSSAMSGRRPWRLHRTTRDLGLVDEAADLDVRVEIVDRYLGRMP